LVVGFRLTTDFLVDFLTARLTTFFRAAFFLTVGFAAAVERLACFART